MCTDEPTCTGVLATCCSYLLLATRSHYSRFALHHSQASYFPNEKARYYLLLTTYYLLLAICDLLSTTCYVLLATCYLLLTRVLTTRQASYFSNEQARYYAAQILMAFDYLHQKTSKCSICSRWREWSECNICIQCCQCSKCSKCSKCST